MSTELKIGAGLGVFVVAACAWFIYTRSSDNQNIPLTGDRPASVEKPADGAPPGSKPATTARPSGKPAASPRKQALTRSNRTQTPRPESTRSVTPRADARRGGPGPAPAKTRPPTRAGQPPDAERPGQGDALLASPGRPAQDTPAAGRPHAPAAQRRRPAPPARTATTPPPGAARQPARDPAEPHLATPAAATSAVPPMRRHAVQSGESFALIAEKYYGSQKYLWFLIQANPQVKDPAKLSIGQVLRVPPAPPSPGAPSPAPPTPEKTEPLRRTYVVQQDDSFYDIARQLLNDGTRWPELYELNKDEVGLDPSNLRVGQVLKVPRR